MKFKLLVHDMTIRSKLMYGLESAALTDSALNKLDTFQLKGIRRILELKTTAVNRAWTNEHLINKANEIIYPDGKNK